MKTKAYDFSSPVKPVSKEKVQTRRHAKGWNEKIMQGVFFIAACASVLAVALICIFLFANGIPAIREIGFVKFLSGEMWRPNNDIYGILPMIVGSIYVTAGAIVVGVPIGILTSVFMAVYCPKKIYRPVSYTHLDVYKRQVLGSSKSSTFIFAIVFNTRISSFLLKSF